MKYMLSVTHEIGAFVTPYMSPTYLVKMGLNYGIDNGCYNEMPPVEKYFGWLEKYKPYMKNCLFVVCFDKVGNAQETLELFNKWLVEYDEWPLAFVAQDGQEKYEFPDEKLWSTLFIGGSTKWKMGLGALECVQRAQKLKKHIHIGRVNYWKRYEHFRSMEGSEDFTCDGNRIIFQGKERAISDWEKHMERTTTPYLSLFDSDSSG